MNAIFVAVVKLGLFRLHIRFVKVFNGRNVTFMKKWNCDICKRIFYLVSSMSF